MRRTELARLADIVLTRLGEPTGIYLFEQVYVSMNSMLVVGATGIEPVTAAMSRQGLQRNPLIFMNMAATLVGVCATIVPLTFSLSGSMNQ